MWAGRSIPGPIHSRIGCSLLPGALAHQVSGVNWRWGLLIGDGNCFPLPLWARFFAKAIEDLDPVSTGFPAMIPADDALRLLALCEEMDLTVTALATHRRTLSVVVSVAPTACACQRTSMSPVRPQTSAASGNRRWSRCGLR